MNNKNYSLVIIGNLNYPFGSATSNRIHAYAKGLVELEQDYKVTIVTQNVDDLHERAGSTNVVHLHGELFKVRSTGNPSNIKLWKSDLIIGDHCEQGYQLRPHIVWFGEAVPKMEEAIDICMTADLLLIIGTSLQVYPAASLMHYVPEHIQTYYVDPKPAISSSGNISVISETATKGMELLRSML